MYVSDLSDEKPSALSECFYNTPFKRIRFLIKYPGWPRKRKFVTRADVALRKCRGITTAHTVIVLPSSVN